MFRLERDLVDEVVRTAPQLFPRESLLVRREWAVGPRIADMAGGLFDRPPSLSRGLEALARVNLTELRFLAHLVPRSLRVTTVARLLVIPPDDAQRMSRRLERAGLVGCSRRGVVTATAWREAMPTELILFEAKLADWRRAVRQGQYYAMHADRVVVVLPATALAGTLLQAKHACRSSGLGLLLALSGGDLRYEHRPPRSRSRDPLRRRVLALHFLRSVASDLLRVRTDADARAV